MIESGVNLAAHYIGGEWRRGAAGASAEILNPATAEPLATLGLAERDDVASAVAAAAAAYPGWRRTPPQERIQYLFHFKQLLHEHAEEIARITTMENGKTLAESRAELQRGIENVEVACGIPTLMQGYNLEDVASGIDEIMIRQPLGVTAAITPFNFPAMIPLWFLPYAIACGNTFILKPSERVPLTALRLFELLHRTGLPNGVVNLVVGAKPAVDALLRHPEVRAISFVGSSSVARYIYTRGRGPRQARPVPGRREEPRRRDARRRSGDEREDRQRQRLRLRRSALPGGFDGDHGGRGVEDVPAMRSPTWRRRSASATAWSRACRWARSSRRRAGRGFSA